MFYSYDIDSNLIYLFEVSDFKIKDGKLYSKTPFSNWFITDNSLIKDKKLLIEIIKTEPLKYNGFEKLRNLEIVFYRFDRIAKLLCKYEDTLILYINLYVRTNK